MNQILSFQSSENGQRQIRKNVRSFAVFIILFALILIGEGGWRLYQNKNKKVYIDTPTINITRNGAKTILDISSDIGIQKIFYTWDDGIENEIVKTGEKQVTEEISNNIGIYDLTLRIVDSNGNTITYDPVKIAYEENGTEDNSDVDWTVLVANDKTMPTVSLSAAQGKVVIEAVDDVLMSYVTYNWNGGEETTVTGLSEDEKTIKAEIDVLKGDNTLYVKAYDKAGNVNEYEREIHGTDGPEITVKREGDEIIVNITDEFGITKIEYNFNNEEKVIDNISETTYELRLPLVDGENFIIISAYESNVMKQYKGKTTK